MSNFKSEISNHGVRRICFVTGTRAEFGLMEPVLRAICASRTLQLQLIVTGMHLDPSRGASGGRIAEGWQVNAIVDWPETTTGPASTAVETGRAMARLAEEFERLGSDIVLVCGDRVEAFAAAAAARISGCAVAHVHGGDRALGQVDDSLRHAITKLSHLHFPATKKSAARILRLGEDCWRIRLCGSPAIDGIQGAAVSSSALMARYGLIKHAFALLLLHPTDADDQLERRRAELLLRILRKSGPPDILVIAPNNDPGSAGILHCWEAHADQVQFHRDLPRGDYLGLLRDAAFLIGNSSSGIIEAASFGTPVIDIGDRQRGRERGKNVRNVSWRKKEMSRAIAAVWRADRPLRFKPQNLYGTGRAGPGIARILTRIPLNERLIRKLISY